ncbi:MAG: sodium:solute symporter family protein [Lachnospiraceae bacterium]|nr:sodium:solute symporter family protein [Lachnospiraceae bacterium]
MVNVFFIALVIYLIVFMIIGVFDLRNIKTFKDYSTAGKNQGITAVVMTLLATVVGASTTIGITDTVYKIGFPGIWWLAFGALGLILQSVFISERVRSIDAYTLPDLAGKIVGDKAEKIIALIIVISWIGVIAGQFVAINNLITFAFGNNNKTVFIIVSIIVIIYTMAGGQMSVVRTDRLQLIIIISGIAVCSGYLYFVKGGNTAEVIQNIELLNENYGVSDLFTQFFVIGGVYFLGPDIISRNFISKDPYVAKRSALAAGIGLLIFSVMITFTGMWIRYNVPGGMLEGKSALMYAITLLPGPVSILLVFGLLSAILSSTDTCLINASAIFIKDILKKESVKGMRITVPVIGGLALFLALLGRSDIMSLLTGAYSVYTPGIIFPLMIAILVYKRYEIKKGIWLSAVITGGVFGILSSYFGGFLTSSGIPSVIIRHLTLIGMGLSLVLSVISVRWGEKRTEVKE